MTCRLHLWTSTVLRGGGGILAVLLALGCGGSSSLEPATPPPPTYPPGWEPMLYADAFRVPAGGPLVADRPLMDWYQKGMASVSRPLGSAGYGCQAVSRTEQNMQFSVVWAVLHGGGPNGIPPLVVEDTFAMIARRSPDMKENEAPEAAGAGYGQGKAYHGENARVFVRVGAMGSVLYIVSVRGDASLDTGNQYLRTFFDGFEPIAR